ncbi:16S rRNA (guanine(966)-N(2))-methyltransferase RsmD [Candidatus Saccharibacteria bacterium]|nr:16S rRNA (guanine(966)-N(2))-methyltransferase RsmD [Candidatus Saccharibacteria bacterium]
MENIRITSGIYRGRIIESPRSKLVHPMGAREKLALFNMIQNFLPGAAVLDAFSGSGALGIEALSRGAKEVVFVEKNPKISQVIKRNLEKMGLEAKIVTTDAKKFTTDKEFGVIIADPPYDSFEIDGVLSLTKYLKDGGILVLSHPGSAPVIPDLKLTDTRKYAQANISIYRFLA